MNLFLFKKIIVVTLFTNLIYTQMYIPADPFNLFAIEKKTIEDKNLPGSLLIRPIFYPDDQNQNNWQLKFRSESYFNTNAPNLENTSNKWIGRGLSIFSSINISYKGKYLAGSIEPFYFFNQNRDYDVPLRIPLLSGLNDNLAHDESPYQSAGLRETQIYLHYKGIGGGFSNANMWWGPGIHSSLMMTNNTSGFGHLMLGTLGEKRYKNWAFNGRYVFSKFDKKSLYEPYYTAVLIGITYYSNPIVTIGLSKAAQTGGTHVNADNVSVGQAMLAILKGFTAGDVSTYEERWSTDDHTVAGYVETVFPKSKLKIFLEVGRNDIAWDMDNLILRPDHSIATVFGFRKYELFYNPNFLFGMEYAKLLSGRYIGRRPDIGPWYSTSAYDYSKYDGRHWGAHSGPDSDDFTIYLGWTGNNMSIMPIFNYERHGLMEPVIQTESGGEESTINPYPEVKIEFRLDLRYKYKDYLINLYLERENIRNLEFREKKRTGTVIWIGIERDFYFNNLKKEINKILNKS
ncbi:capsule assembly Wzi family protein [Candidatus Neomarinimicrobiota bacterium]